MSGLNSNIVGLALAASVAGVQAEEPKVAPTGNEQVAVTTQAATQRLMVAMDTTLVAQAAPAESDGKPPITVMVKQVDGSMKAVSYYRNKRGAIIPPPIVDGKLVDGNPAPADPIDAKIAQRQVLVPYDKNAQIALAMVGDRDLIKESGLYIKGFMDKVEAGKNITKVEFEEYLFQTFISMETGIKGDGLMKLADSVATIKLKLTPVEYNTMKSEAQAKAKKIWKATTGAVA